MVANVRHCAIRAWEDWEFNQRPRAAVKALQKRCESAMMGLGYGARMERGVVTSRLTGLPHLCVSSALVLVLSHL